MTGMGGTPAITRCTGWTCRAGRVRSTGTGAKASGVSFAFIKATEGGDVADPMFDDHRRGAQSAGVPWGAYHYYYFCRPAHEQARWFIRNVPRGADLPHVLDMEWTPHSRTCRLRPDGAKVRAEA